MTYIIISILMIILGTIGVIKTKPPKLNGTPGFAAEARFYFTLYVLIILGFVFLYMEIKEKMNH